MKLDPIRAIRSEISINAPLLVSRLAAVLPPCYIVSSYNTKPSFSIQFCLGILLREVNVTCFLPAFCPGGPILGNPRDELREVVPCSGAAFASEVVGRRQSCILTDIEASCVTGSTYQIDPLYSRVLLHYALCAGLRTRFPPDATSPRARRGIHDLALSTVPGSLF